MPELIHLPSWIGTTFLVVVGMFMFDKLVGVLSKIEVNTRREK